ncbi:VC0807 family protein [Actinoalloteichus caeruleus]|uniref:VC0807 family protein n=1 Tax=Actinoalloteichus cyanogriseus TaxID=2893586 RepID=UPI003BB969A9
MGGDERRPRSPVRPARVLGGVFLDAGLSVSAYLVFRWAGAGDYLALLAGTVVAGLRLGWVLLRTRRLDAFALFMTATFAVGLGLSFVTGDARFLLLKESVGTAVTGLLFLLTCLLRRPLLYAASKRFAGLDAAESTAWDERWRASPHFRRLFYRTTIVWGLGFVAEAVLRVPLVFLLPIPVMATVGSLGTPVLIVGLLGWTLWYGPRRELRVQEIERAEAAGAAGTDRENALPAGTEARDRTTSG